MGKSFFEWIAFFVERYGLWYLKGAGTTLFIAFVSTVIGFGIGLLVGVIKKIPRPEAGRRLSPRGVVLAAANALLTVYVEVFRGTPMMVQAIVIFYGFKEALGLDLSPLFAGILVVSINTGAYMAEVVRGGIESIDPGQTEAAQAIGMTHFQLMTSIVLPQAIRNILPATGNEFIINIKDTSVLNVIMLTELFFQTRSVSGIYMRTYEPFLIAAAVYLTMTLSMTYLLRALERRMDGPRNFTLVAASSTMPNVAIKKHLRAEVPNDRH